MTDTCPICFSDLTAKPMIGEEVRGVYDGVLIWHCPDCGGMWPRFSGGPRHSKAVQIINSRIKEDEYVAAQAE